MRTTFLSLIVLAAGAAWAAQEPPKAETAVPAERAGETDDGARVFPPLPVPHKAMTYADPSVAALAGKIATGTADLRERRAWYALSLLYAPFDALPAPDWRRNALRTGAGISIETRRLERTAGTIASADPPSYAWTSLGPTNYNVGGADRAQGRASALWVYPFNNNFIFAGFAGGGIWKTTDGGTTWTAISDFEVTTSIGSIDVLVRTDTVNLTDAIVYVGLGEGNTSADAIDGAGVLKSMDGGATWTLQTIPWAGPDAATSPRWRHSIRRIAIDKSAPSARSVWVAGDGGVYHTSNGGTTWSLITALPYTGKPGVGGCWQELATDFVTDTSVFPTRLYAAFGARSNGSAFAELSCTGIANDPDFRKNNGVYRSLDGGVTWTKITGPGSGFPEAPGQVGRITLLQAPSAKQQIYALVSCAGGGCPNGQHSSLGIFKTTDASAAGVTWTAGSTTNFCANQGWYDLTGAVDPANPSKLLVGGLDVYLSTDAGGSLVKKSSWVGTGTGYVHADQHHMVYASQTRVFIASDGGIFRGTIGGTSISWAHLNGGGLSTLQFYGIGQHPVTPNRIHGGLQDNGEAYTADGVSWYETEGGDGGFSATDWSDGEIAYEEYVYGAIARSTTGGASSWTCIQNFGGCGGCGGCIPDGQTAFIAPMTLDANNASILYTGSKYVYRNAAAPTGSSWSAISPDLVGTPYDAILNIHSARNGGVPGTIWATTLNGKVWATKDDGAGWTDTTKAPLPDNPVLPNRAATWSATHPDDGLKAVVVYSGWNGTGAQPGHVFRTLDGGVTWTDVSGGLPDEPVFTVAVDPARPDDVYIGTEYGVYVNTAGWSGSAWTRVNAGQLPHVHVHQLEFSRANGKLRAATHGRGIWELTVTCAGAAEVSSALSGSPLRVDRAGDDLVIGFEELPGAAGYNVYDGALGSWYSHATSPTNACSAVSTPSAGRREVQITPSPGDRYFLVTAYACAEGPSGFATDSEIPPNDSTCSP